MSKIEVPVLYEYLRWNLERKLINNERFTIKEARQCFNLFKIPNVIHMRVLKEMQEFKLLSLDYGHVTLNKKHKPRIKFFLKEESPSRILLA